MRLKLFESTNLFLIYRDKYGVFAYASIVGLFTFAIGCVFAFIGWGETGNLPFKVFGGTFVIAGLACLFSIKRLASSIYKSLGLPVLSISKDQLIVYPGIGSSSATYRWHQVQKIVIVGKLFSEDSDGPTKHNNQVVIFFLTPLRSTTAPFRTSKTNVQLQKRGQFTWSFRSPIV